MSVYCRTELSIGHSVGSIYPQSVLLPPCSVLCECVHVHVHVHVKLNPPYMVRVLVMAFGIMCNLCSFHGMLES